MGKKHSFLAASWRVLRSVLFTILALASSGWAASVDDGFNPGADNYVYAIALQPDGKILVGGSFNTIGGQSRNYIARLNIDGSVDAGFNPGANERVFCLAVQADGKILVGGAFTTIGGQTRNRIARLNSDGTVDAGFNPGAGYYVWTIKVQADNKILIGGSFAIVGGQSRNYIARLNTDGSVDTGFNPNANSTVSEIAVQAGGKILIGGHFTTIGGQSRNYIARLNTDGSVDTDFNPGTDYTVYALAVQADNKILVGGEFTTVGGQARNRIARLDSEGGVDTGFNPGVNDLVLSLSVQPDGKILVGGQFGTIGGQTLHNIARLNIDGTVDTGFIDANPNGAVQTLALQNDGQILVGGEFTSCGGAARGYIARMNVDNSVERTLDPGPDSGVYSIIVQPDGEIVVGGIFATIGGLTRNHIARLNVATSVDAVFNPNADGNIFPAAIQPDNKILVGGTFSNIGGASRVCLARLNSDGSADSGFNPGANNAVFAIVLQPDSRIVVGGDFTNMGVSAKSRIARLNSDGSVDSGFNTEANDTLYTAALQADNKILIGGEFTYINSVVRNRIARLNSDGTLDTGFVPEANNVVRAIIVQPDGKILVGGQFTAIASTARNRIARLNSDGTIDTGFNPGSNGTVMSIALQADNKILVAGNFTVLGGSGRNYIARLNSDGSLDTNFNPGPNLSVSAIAVQPDGKILVGGVFTTIAGQARNYFARLSADDAALQDLSVSADGTTVTWLRGQSSPEIQDVIFEYSADLSTWGTLGTGTRISGGWQLTGLTLPFFTNWYVRGRGRLAGGYYNGCTSLLESVRLFYNETTITVISPNGGESWTGGDLHPITWSSVGSIANVNIDLSTDNGSSWNPVAASTTNDGTYSWTVPTVASTTCLIRISDALNSSVNDVSDAVFTIVAPAETISTPSTPTGPSSGLNSTSYDFSTSGSTSSLGHDVQYKFDWNDGTDSGWLAVGTTNASHSWATNGTYNIRAMARCAIHTNLESLWSESHPILISDTGSAGYYNSPAGRVILPEVNWALASGGGTWMVEAQVIDISGGSQVSVYYNHAGGRRGPFLLWTGTAPGSSTRYDNLLDAIDQVDSEAFTYYGTVGAVEFVTQDATHLIQVAMRQYNGNYSKTHPGLADVAATTADTSRQMVIPNLASNATYRTFVGCFNPSADSVTVEFRLADGSGAMIGTTVTRTIAGYGYDAFNVFTEAGVPYPGSSYSNTACYVHATSGSGRVMCFGATANNSTNDPAAHVAVQTTAGNENSPAGRVILPEVNWALASGGGTWMVEAQVIDSSGGSQVSVYYNHAGGRRGPFLLWTGTAPGSSVRFDCLLDAIDQVDSGAFTYYGTVGAVEFVTQDGSHLIQVAMRQYNGNYSKTHPGLADVAATTADTTRQMVIPNLASNATYRTFVGCFNPTADSVTMEFRLADGSGAMIGTTVTRTIAGYGYDAFNVFTEAGVPYPGNSYSNAACYVHATSGTGRVMCFGATANNSTNDPAAHVAVQGQ